MAMLDATLNEFIDPKQLNHNKHAGKLDNNLSNEALTLSHKLLIVTNLYTNNKLTPDEYIAKVLESLDRFCEKGGI